ncbi:unnamed protein product [Ophioblennius macclurei]
MVSAGKRSKRDNRWRRKIRTHFPLIFSKTSHRPPEDLPEADSDFEEIAAPEKQPSSNISADLQKPSGASAASANVHCSEKELSTPQVAADEEARPPPTSTLQLIASAFRRTFSRTDSSTSSISSNSFSSSSAVTRRSEAPRSQSLGDSLLSSTSSDVFRDEKKKKKVDLNSLLQQVTLRGRDDSALPPRRRLDLFSSLRLKKSEGRPGQEEEEEFQVQKEIRTILSNLRNKASSQPSPEESSCSDHEDQHLTSSVKLHPEKLRKQQEKKEAEQVRRDTLKRLHRAQVIQRQLEEVGEKQRELEERGVLLEKTIRGETDVPPADDNEEAQLYQSWFKLVLEKNRLARYESELIVFAQELELEDTQSCLQQELRRRMAEADTEKSSSELQEEQEILQEIMRTVESRDLLVSLLEQQRLKEREEDRDLESLVLSRGYHFHWGGSE